ncbi:MAG: hypothetical protein QX191_09150, partial [Methylococcaceae bacterium]
MLRSHSAVYKKTNNEIAIATIYCVGYSHPKARYFLLLRQKKVSKEKAARLQLNLRSSVLSGVGREGFLPSYRLAASMPRPFGLIPTKPAVLSAS